MSQTFRSYPTCNPALNIALEVLTANGFRLYWLLRTWWHHRRTRFSYYTVTSLSKILHLQRSTVRVHLRELRLKKLLRTYYYDARHKILWYMLQPITSLYPSGFSFRHPAVRPLQPPNISPPNIGRPNRSISDRVPGQLLTTNPLPKEGRRKGRPHARPAPGRRSATGAMDSPSARGSPKNTGGRPPVTPPSSPRLGEHLGPFGQSIYDNMTPAERRKAEDRWQLLEKVYGTVRNPEPKKPAPVKPLRPKRRRRLPKRKSPSKC